MTDFNEQLAGARETWISQGNDPAMFDRYVPAVAAPPAPPGSPPNDKPPAAVVAQQRWTDQQAAESIAEFRARGVPDADIRQGLAGDGFTAEKIDALLAPAAPDTRTDQQRMLDNAGLGAAKAEDYRPIDYMGRMPDGVELFAFDTAAKDFLAAIGAPALIGPSMLEECLDGAKAYAALPEAHRELFHQTEDSRLVDILGPAAATTVNERIMGLLSDPAVPLDFLEWLKSSGALRRTEVRYQLANIADLRKARTAA